MIGKKKHVFSSVIITLRNSFKFLSEIFIEESNEIFLYLKYLLKKGYAEFTLKKIVSIVLFIFIFLFFQEKIRTFIESYLISHNDFSNKYLDVLLIILSSLFIVKTYNKIILNRYKSSFIEYFLLGIILFISIFYYKISINNNWTFVTTSILDIKIPYLMLFLLPIVSFFILHINRSFNLDAYKKEFYTKDNFIINDNPIEQFSNDELGLGEIVDKLSSILIKDNHNKSLSIGLISPWGNGKSSVINLLEDKIKNTFSYKEKDIISIHFLPYLNHKEDDIINEFFLNLSNNLSQFNGKISNQLLDYSSKLTELYKDKNLKNFFDKNINSYTNSSAQDLYNMIDEMLVSLNKKIIVFIDDLDRLNQNEILQVLKLIRNTANFRNTIFVVAMDKEYVLSRLKSSNDILNTKFIDKFFQLEVYLPDIQINILRNYFIVEINKPFENMPSDFKDRIDKVFESRTFLFNDYIKNFRDVKRVINQIKFDLSLYKEDHYYLNLKDFINFTFFKLKFPKFMKNLSEGKSDYIELDPKKGIYSLVIHEPEGETKSNENDIILFDIYDVKYLNKYKIFNSFFKKQCEDDLSFNCEDKMLLVKTLAYLFGTENNIENVDSIRHQNNFKILMEQRFPKNYLKNTEFNELFTTDLINIKSYLENLNNDQKLYQLIERLKYYSNPKPENNKSIIKALVKLFEKNKDYNLYIVDILFLLNKFVEELYLKDKSNKQEIDFKQEDVEWLKENIFEDINISIKTRLELLGKLWDSKEINDLWHLDKEYCKTIAVKLFKEYLDEFNDNLWEVNNYNVYGVYHDIKKVNLNEINIVFKDFWDTNHIELLCAQSTDLESFSNVNFRITDTVIEIFGSRNEFISFIKTHKDKELPAVKEFLKLFKLLQIINFSGYIIFEFNTSKLMLEKIKHIINYPGRTKSNESDNYQIFIETNNLEITNRLLNDSVLYDGYLVRRFLFNKKDYLVATFKKQDFVVKSLDMVNYIIKNHTMATNFKYLEKPVYENLSIEIDNKEYLKIISIQPPLKNDSPNYETY